MIWSYSDVAKMIDHSLLNPSLNAAQLETLACHEKHWRALGAAVKLGSFFEAGRGDP